MNIWNNFWKKILNEGVPYADNIDYKKNIIDLIKFYQKEYSIITKPPKVKFIHNDKRNASDFLGKTAHYDPNTKLITIYTEGRHPSSILSSFSHEMVHFIQDLQGRIKNINTNNVLKDGYLEELELEAYGVGGIMLRKWRDHNSKNDK
jgi:hypothetical protein